MLWGCVNQCEILNTSFACVQVLTASRLTHLVFVILFSCCSRDIMTDFQQNRAGMLTRQRTGRGIVNVVIDQDAIATCESQARYDPGKVYYKAFDRTTGQLTSTPLMPQGAYANSHKTIFDYEIGLIPRYEGDARTTNTGEYKAQLPITTTWNGEIGDSISDLQKRRRPGGFVEKPGALIKSGIISVPKEVPGTFFNGDYLMAVPPQRDEVDPNHTKLVPPDGQGATREGRVHSVLKVYDPTQYNFLDAEVVVKVLDAICHTQPGGPQGNTFVLKDASAWDPDGSLYQTDLSLYGVIAAIIKALHVYVPSPAAYFAAAICFGGPAGDVGEKLYKELAVKYDVEAEFDNAALHKARIQKTDPIRGIIRALAILHRDTLDCIMGTCVSGAEKAGDSCNIHMHKGHC
jgi:hypothetical protein